LSSIEPAHEQRTLQVTRGALALHRLHARSLSGSLTSDSGGSDGRFVVHTGAHTPRRTAVFDVFAHTIAIDNNNGKSTERDRSTKPARPAHTETTCCCCAATEHASEQSSRDSGHYSAEHSPLDSAAATLRQSCPDLLKSCPSNGAWKSKPVKQWTLDDTILWLQHLQLDSIATLIIGELLVHMHTNTRSGYDITGVDINDWTPQHLGWRLLRLGLT
jgi:hypothetical protein